MLLCLCWCACCARGASWACKWCFLIHSYFAAYIYVCISCIYRASRLFEPGRSMAIATVFLLYIYTHIDCFFMWLLAHLGPDFSVRWLHVDRCVRMHGAFAHRAPARGLQASSQFSNVHGVACGIRSRNWGMAQVLELLRNCLGV